jgi:hypothetical protein
MSLVLQQISIRNEKAPQCPFCLTTTMCADCRRAERTSIGHSVCGHIPSTPCPAVRQTYPRFWTTRLPDVDRVLHLAWCLIPFAGMKEASRNGPPWIAAPILCAVMH